MTLTVIVGPTHSGRSTLAAKLSAESGGAPIYDDCDTNRLAGGTIQPASDTTQLASDTTHIDNLYSTGVIIVESRLPCKNAILRWCGAPVARIYLRLPYSDRHGLERAYKQYYCGAANVTMAEFREAYERATAAPFGFFMFDCISAD